MKKVVVVSGSAAACAVRILNTTTSNFKILSVYHSMLTAKISKDGGHEKILIVLPKH